MGEVTDEDVVCFFCHIAAARKCSHSYRPFTTDISALYLVRVSYRHGSMERQLNGANIYIMSWLMAAYLEYWSGQGPLKLFLATVARGHKHLEGSKKKTRLLFVYFFICI